MFSIPFFLAFCFRMRGRAIEGWSTQYLRLLFWVLPLYLSTLNPYVAICGFLGLMIPHGRWFGDASLKSSSIMALIGMARLALILAPLAYLHPLVLSLAPVGLLSGVATCLAWKYLHGKALPIIFYDKPFVVAGSDYRELADGFLFGLALALVPYLV